MESSFEENPTYLTSCNFGSHEMKIQVEGPAGPSQNSGSAPYLTLNDSSTLIDPSSSFEDSPLNQPETFNLVNQSETVIGSEPARMNTLNTGEQKKRIVDSSANSTTNPSNHERLSSKDSSSCLFICRIGGSPPKIQRIFTTVPRSIIETALENSSISEVEIIGGKRTEKMIEQILRFGEWSRSNHDEIIAEEPGTLDFSDTDSSQEDFGHLVEIVETYEDILVSTKEEKDGRYSGAEVCQHRSGAEVCEHSSGAEVCQQSSGTEVCQSSLSEDLPSHQSELAGIRISKILSPKPTTTKSLGAREVSRRRKKVTRKFAQPSKDYQIEDNTCFEVKRGQFECDICHNTFSSKYSVRDHILAKHPPSENLSDNRPFQCEKCAQAFVRKSYLNEHLRMAHSEQPKYPCPSCPKIFKREKYLEYHTLRAHSNAKPLLCQHCGAAFSLVFALNEHVRYHHSEGFKCQDCGRVFKRSSTLIIHSRPRVQGPKPICRYCKETFMNKCSLQVHIQKMHADVYQYPCQSCDLKFTLKRTMISHMKLVHDGIRNHPCPLCDKYFKNAAGVRVHLSNVHNHERNFKCGLCGRSFKTRQVYNEHMALRHPI